MSEILPVAFAVLFLVSGSAKLTDLAGFRAVLRDSYEFPTLFASAAAPVVPTVEIASSVLLLTQHILPGLVLAFGLLLAIASIVTRAWIRGATGECGCLGTLVRDRISFATVLRAALLLCLAGLAIVLRLGWLDSPDAQIGNPALSAALSVVGAGILVMLLVAAAAVLRPASRP
jgi:hypothetical protein